MSKAMVVETTGRNEARFLIDNFYKVQNDRIGLSNQISAAKREGVEISPLIPALFDQQASMEKQIEKHIRKFTKAHPIAKWCESITGVGPVLAAGLVAYIDIERAPTAGHIWSYAGLNPEMKWEKGQKRPFNATLKTICWKIGQSFKKLNKNPNCYYGKIYRDRKEYENAKNENGDYADQAKNILAKKKIGKSTVAYEYYSQGKLPPGHIDARACRYAVKIFLSHLHQTWYEWHHGEKAPKPFVIEHLGHVHLIPPPLKIEDI